MENKTDLSKYIVSVQGKDFITFNGLLAEAHAQGLTKIDTVMVNGDINNPVFKATVTVDGKEFTGYGDANVDNVARQVSKALIRMSETRSIARALRFACNIDMAAIEELDGDSSNVVGKSKSKPKETVKVATPKLKTPTINPEAKEETQLQPKTETKPQAAVEPPKKLFKAKKFVTANEPKF
jgi:hypothetical protein